MKAVRLQDGTVTNNPKAVLEEVLHSFRRQHSTKEEELSAYTEELISYLPRLYNQTQRQDMHRTPFTIRELDEVLYKLQPGKTPRVDGSVPKFPAELYRRLSEKPKETLDCAPVGYRHQENGRTSRLGQPGTPAVKERRMGEPRQLETHSMRHHGSQTRMDAHPQTGGSKSIPSYTAHNVGSHTG